MKFCTIVGDVIAEPTPLEAGWPVLAAALIAAVIVVTVLISKKRKK